MTERVVFLRFGDLFGGRLRAAGVGAATDLALRRDAWLAQHPRRVGRGRRCGSGHAFATSIIVPVPPFWPAPRALVGRRRDGGREADKPAKTTTIGYRGPERVWMLDLSRHGRRASIGLAASPLHPSTTSRTPRWLPASPGSTLARCSTVTVRHLLWLRDRLGDMLLDAMVITTGPHAYRRPDGVAVVP